MRGIATVGLVGLMGWLGGCKDGPLPDTGGDDDVLAIVDPSRSGHYFDVPFPSNDLLDATGHADLTGFPLPEPELPATILGGWVERIERTAQGFGNNTAAYFRFADALTLPDRTEGLPDDPVLWVAMDGSELLPLEVRFVADPQGDPMYGENTLAMAPALGHPMRSGGTYAAVVMRSAGVRSPDGYALPDGVVDALVAAGVSGEPAVATVFTVQDPVGELRALAADVDGRLDFSGVTLRRVVRATYTQGTTPSGADATVFTAYYDDGSTRQAYLAPEDDYVDIDQDLVDGWPMVVWEADLPTWNYQGLEDRPYMSPGLGHIGDAERFTGWIDFVDGQPAREPVSETMRVTIQLPKGLDGAAADARGVVMHDHGTAGHAYNIVQRVSHLDHLEEILVRYADAGFAVIGRDATLYGTRYPLIDEGYGGSLGFYNIVNAPAFRDNQRQTAVDGHVLLRWIQDGGLNDALPEGSVDPAHIRRSGHSLGSVTANNGLAMDPDAYEAALLSGTGGVFLHYFFDTGLLQAIDLTLVESLFPLVGAEPPEEMTTTTILGAVLGLEPEAWDHLDRLHPGGALFQWQIDPSDPMALARDETAPITAVIAPGDWQTPDFTAEALVNAMPNAVAVPCEAQGDYDPHYCIWREPEGWAAVEAWVAE